MAAPISLGKTDQSLSKNFDFSIVSEWLGYNSSSDPTNIAENIYVQGSQNIYKTLAGTLSVRPGQKMIGSANTAIASVTSEYFWRTSWGAIYPVWVSNGYVQVYINGTWTNLMSTSKMRFIFDKWYDQTQGKDDLLFVCGDNNIYQWSGGIATITEADNSTGYISNLSPTPTSGGSGYVVGDVVTIGSGTATAKVTSVGTGGIATSTLIFAGLPLPNPASYPTPAYTVGEVYALVGADNSQGGSITVTSVNTGGGITGYTLFNSGTGYNANVTYSVYNTFPPNLQAQITVNTVNSDTVTGLELLTTSSGYSTGTGKSTSGGSGTGLTVDILAVAQAGITASGSSTLQQVGFSTAGVVLVGGTAYTYQYLIGNTFVGVTPNPAGITGTAIQQVVTQTGIPLSTNTTQSTSSFTNDFLKVINNQVFVGSYNSRLVFISNSQAYINFVPPAVSYDSGDANLLTMDATVNGFGVKAGAPYVSYGTAEWAYLTYTSNSKTSAVETVVNIAPSAEGAAAYSQEFIDSTGDNILYLSKDQQLRTIGNFNLAYVQAYPVLSQEIYTEIEAENFTGGGLRCIGDFTYITAPISGKTYLYQERYTVNANNQVAIERLWHSPFIWNASRIDDWNGTVVSFSNANPMWYEVWNTGQWHDDSPSGEPLPYNCILALSYRTNGRRQGLWNFDKVYSEGYITPGTPLSVTINYDYQGATAQITSVVNSVDQPATLFTTGVSSLGDTALGDKPLGDDLNMDETNNGDMPKFKVINSLTQQNCFEYQPIYSSNAVDANWQILATGTNVHPVMTQQADYIINKKPLTN